jgi:hypothetical protein
MFKDPSFYKDWSEEQKQEETRKMMGKHRQWYSLKSTLGTPKKPIVSAG